MSYIIAFLVLSFLIFIHELGHFLAGKLMKMPVKTFAIGFGPTILKWSRGGTDYKLNLLPLGGYVSIEGEDAEDIEGGFLSQPWYKRYVVLVAGIVFNFISALVIFVIIFSFYGVPNRGVQIVNVVDQTAAAEYIKPNDQLISINEHVITSENLNSISDFVSEGKDKPLDVKIRRDQETFEYQIPLSTVDGKDILGISSTTSLMFVPSKITLSTIFIQPFIETKEVVKLILQGLNSLVSGQVSSGDVQGPVGIVKITSDIAKTSVPLLLYWVALLDLNLGVMNALPIPALDGGQILFLFLETIVGKNRWNKKVATVVNQVFFILLIGFSLYVTAGDVIHLFK